MQLPEPNAPKRSERRSPEPVAPVRQVHSQIEDIAGATRRLSLGGRSGRRGMYLTLPRGSLSPLSNDAYQCECQRTLGRLCWRQLFSTVAGAPALALVPQSQSAAVAGVERLRLRC